VPKGGSLDERLPWLAAASDPDVVGLRRDVGGDGNGVPNPGVVSVGDVAAIERAICHIDKAIVRKPDRNRGFGDVVDVFSADGQQAVEIRFGGASFELEVQGVGGRQRGFAAQPAVACAHIGARPGTCRHNVVEASSKSRSPRSIADLSDCAGACKDRHTEEQAGPRNNVLLEHESTP
jgi:hypothetical protein